jgi:hypothetical protein
VDEDRILGRLERSARWLTRSLGPFTAMLDLGPTRTATIFGPVR